MWPDTILKKVCLYLINNDLLNKVKDVLIGAQAAGAVILYYLAIVIGKIIVKANNSRMLVEDGDPLKLIEDCVRRVPKSLEWSGQKEITCYLRRKRKR